MEIEAEFGAKAEPPQISAEHNGTTTILTSDSQDIM